MKKVVFSCLLASMVCGLCAQKVVEIPAMQSVELEYATYDCSMVTIDNQTAKGLNVSVRSKADGKQVRGFGLGPKGKEEVAVESGNKLVLKNNTTKKIRVVLSSREAPKTAPSSSRDYVDFTLLNKTMSSIPLIIPSVMNPNLSPFSKSGVSLKMGQEILFNVNGKKYVLLTVDESIRNGEELDVAKRLKERKEELGLR